MLKLAVTILAVALGPCWGRNAELWLLEEDGRLARLPDLKGATTSAPPSQPRLAASGHQNPAAAAPSEAGLSAGGVAAVVLCAGLCVLAVAGLLVFLVVRSGRRRRGALRERPRRAPTTFLDAAALDESDGDVARLLHARSVPARPVHSATWDRYMLTLPSDSVASPLSPKAATEAPPPPPQSPKQRPKQRRSRRKSLRLPRVFSACIGSSSGHSVGVGRSSVSTHYSHTPAHPAVSSVDTAHAASFTTTDSLLDDSASRSSFTSAVTSQQSLGSTSEGSSFTSSYSGASSDAGFTTTRTSLSTSAASSSAISSSSSSASSTLTDGSHTITS